MATVREFPVTYALICCVLTRIYATSNRGYERCQLPSGRIYAVFVKESTRYGDIGTGHRGCPTVGRERVSTRRAYCLGISCYPGCRHMAGQSSGADQFHFL